MKIIVPPLVRPIYLTDYAPELKDESGAPVVVWVWVNPPVAWIARLNAGLTDRQSGVNLDEMYAEAWSQHADPATHWSAEDVRALIAHETDPALFVWLARRTREEIEAHRAGEKKA